MLSRRLYSMTASITTNTQTRRAISQLPDICKTPWYDVAESYYKSVHSHSFGKSSSASQPNACPNRPLVAVRVGISDSLDANPGSRIAIVDTTTGSEKIIDSDDEFQHSSPKWCPRGKHLAFLSDRLQKGVMGLHILASEQLNDTGPVPMSPSSVPGSVESFSWSPDGSLVLLQVAEHGADEAAAHGSGSIQAKDDADKPSWLPSVSNSDEATGWRSAWIYDMISGQLRRATKPGLNIWEAAWMGPDRLFAVVSNLPTEDAWYETRMAIIDLHTGSHQTVYQRDNQLGIPAATPSGSLAAFVNCLSSDRGGVAGEAVLLHTQSLATARLDLNEVDVTYLQWIDEDKLLFIGLRGVQTIAGHYYASSGLVEEHWVSDGTCGTLYPEATATKDGEIAVISEAWDKYQQLDMVHNSESRTIKSWANEGSRWLQSQVGQMESVTWKAPDGLEIQGYLCFPTSDHKSPYPLILGSHGGPVWTFRNTWSMSSGVVPLLVSQGFAVLSANPRGSTGKGHDFVAKVVGDMGGKDAQDLLSGVESMVHRGIADKDQLGVMGVSYGGYMSAWLPTLSPMFKASVPIAPITNWYSYHNTSNIGRYDELFFQQSPHEPGNMYHHRSPVMFAGRYPTPIMQVVGGSDRCVHPSQSLEYHKVLTAKGINSVLLQYPGEGHGIRNFPAYIDFSARVLNWFDTHLRSKSNQP